MYGSLRGGRSLRVFREIGSVLGKEVGDDNESQGFHPSVFRPGRFVDPSCFFLLGKDPRTGMEAGL